MCDLLCALGPAAAGGVTLFAKNSDRPPDEPQAIEWLAPRREAATRTTYLEIPGHDGPTYGVLGSRPTWMWGLEHGVNTAGVAIGNATIFTTLDPRRFPPALVGMDLVRLGLERAGSAGAAVDVMTALLETHGQGGSGHAGADRPYWSSFLVADHREAFVLETSATTWMVESVADSRAISNRTTIPAFDAQHRHPRQPTERLVDPRLQAGCRLLAERRPLGRLDLQRHLRTHAGGDDGWTVCMHVEGVEATTAALVAPLAGPQRAAAPAWFLLGSPCSSVFVPLVVDEPVPGLPAWERFAALSPAARPALDELEAELDAGVAAGSGPGWNAAVVERLTAALEALGV
jgi:hypothetical protein